MKNLENDFKGKSVLITGDLGFIGSNLAYHLEELGANVVLVDSLIPQYGGNLFNVESIKDLVQINISDVRDEYSMQHLGWKPRTGLKEGLLKTFEFYRKNLAHYL